jgi:hypothetical protein
VTRITRVLKGLRGKENSRTNQARVYLQRSGLGEQFPQRRCIVQVSKVFILILVLALLAIPLTAQANAWNSQRCSLATLNGSYGFFAQGAIMTDPPIQLVVTGIIKYDGAGNLSGESVTSDGSGAGAPGTLAGTYTVSPDCIVTGQHTGDGETLHFVGPITGNGMLQEIHWVLTDPGFVAAGTSKKMPAGGCSVATLKGSYGLFGQGTVTAYNPPAPITHAGSLTYDGKGKFAGSDTIALNGSIVPDQFTGTYTVSQDCTISVEINSTAVGVVHQLGRITGEGKNREVHLIVTDPGFLFLETTRKQ